MTLQFMNGKLHIGRADKIMWFFDKMQAQGGFMSQLTSNSEGTLRELRGKKHPQLKLQRLRKV